MFTILAMTTVIPTCEMCGISTNLGPNKNIAGMYLHIPYSIWDYHLVIEHSHGESPLNGGFNGKIIYKWVIVHSYVK